MLLFFCVKHNTRGTDGCFILFYILGNCVGIASNLFRYLCV